MPRARWSPISRAATRSLPSRRRASPRLEGFVLEADPGLARRAPVLDIVHLDLVAPGELGVAEAVQDRAAHLARSERSEAVEHGVRGPVRELPAPVVRAADLAVDRLGDAPRAVVVRRVD